MAKAADRCQRSRLASPDLMRARSKETTFLQAFGRLSIIRYDKPRRLL